MEKAVVKNEVDYLLMKIMMQVMYDHQIISKRELNKAISSLAKEYCPLNERLKESDEDTKD